MNQLGTVYATKRRRRNSKSLKPPPKDGLTKSNPSKRHRERLNAELDTLASLLPFEATILSKLDKLSILRLSVSYLRTKSYFQVSMYGLKEGHHHHHHHHHHHQGPTSGSGGGGTGTTRGMADLNRNHDVGVGSPCMDAVLDSDLILQALNGFLLILASEGEVFFASHTIESYLGFHQSDIVHQSVYELVHSEDREELQRQLMWNSFLPADGANMTFQEVLQPENCQYLERSFTVRFRCLLDNTSGFLRLDIRGRIKVLHGQNHKTDEPPLALFAVCTPFGPPSLLEVPQKDVMFKSKHKLDMSLVSMDQRGKMLLGYSDSELTNKGGYDLVHFDDLAYVANAHQELLKTGASGMIAYRVITKDGQWQWLQTSSRLVYKCSKPDFIICTHRPLMEEEGRDLLGKRTMDFKVSYLDATLNSSSYSSDGTDAAPTNNNSTGIGSTTTTTARSPKTRRYKNQLRDILTTCRKRKTQPNEYLEDTTAAAYGGGGSAGVYTYPVDNGLAPYMQTNIQNLYPSLDNSRFLSAEDLFQYRHLSNYYTDYSHQPTQYAPMHGNGYLEMPSRACLPPSYTDAAHLVAAAASSKDDKLYPCQLESAKYNNDGSMAARLLASSKSQISCCDGYMTDHASRGYVVPSAIQPLMTPTSIVDKVDGKGKMREVSSPSSPSRNNGGDDNDSPSKHAHSHHHHHQHHPSPPMHHYHQQHESTGETLLGAKPSIIPAYSNDTRQTVLMWGSTGVTCRSAVTTPSNSASPSPTDMYPTDKSGAPGGGYGADGHLTSQHLKQEQHLSSNHHHHHHQQQHHSQSHHVLNDLNISCKWGNGTVVTSSAPKSTSPHASSPHVITTTARVLAPAVGYCNSSPYGTDMTAAGELQHTVAGVDKHDGNPLLSISEVTNALLSHE